MIWKSMKYDLHDGKRSLPIFNGCNLKIIILQADLADDNQDNDARSDEEVC